jgi:hypothetical protein
VTTANLALPEISASQSQKHVTHNQALRYLDALVQLSVIDDTLTAPPGGESNGDRYIPLATATGAWAGQEGKIAAYQDDAWYFYTPQEGWICWVSDTSKALIYTGSSWVPYLGMVGANGGRFSPVNLVESVTMSGASTNSTINIPNGSWVAGVSMRVTTTITGPTDFAVGISGETSKFGSSLGVSAGSTNFGITGGQAYYSDTPVLFTPNGGSFTGGVVSIHIYGWQCTPPTS